MPTGGGRQLQRKAAVGAGIGVRLKGRFGRHAGPGGQGGAHPGHIINQQGGAGRGVVGLARGEDNTHRVGRQARHVLNGYRGQRISGRQGGQQIARLARLAGHHTLAVHAARELQGYAR